ncbi:DNA cytosine methyltransferase [Streptomyces malaysiensis]
MEIVDLFAGPGGLDMAARCLGIPVVGIASDANVCATRRKAGLATVEGDVRTFSPADFPGATVIAGKPPCQTFSIAGRGEGRRALDDVLRLVRRMGDRDDIAADLAQLNDERTGLVLEPLRWALAAVDAGRPYDAIVLEQVPIVLPVWEAVGEALATEGYSVACGRLSAEQFGVPQTRRQAVLIARRNGVAALPKATHRPYRKDVLRAEGDPALLPWVTMGEALDRPTPFLVVSNYGSGGDPRARGRRTSEEPSFAVTGKVSRNRVQTEDGIELPRLSAAEVGRLQSFPADHPWSGHDIPQQIGSSVPPLLAAHVLAAALGRDCPRFDQLRDPSATFPRQLTVEDCAEPGTRASVRGETSSFAHNDCENPPTSPLGRPFVDGGDSLSVDSATFGRVNDSQIKPGQITTRTEMMDVFGGGPQGGIVASATTPNILIYSDHETGHRYGYYDGWLAEEDDNGSIFEYTGAGRIGDQTFTGRTGSGNKAILQHVDEGRALRVFIAAGKVPGSGAKYQRYVGEFALDADLPYVIRQVPDDNGSLRKAIVFRLRPAGAVGREEQDDIPLAEKTQATLVPADVTASTMVEPENNKKTKGKRSAQRSTETERREAVLSDDFRAFLKSKEHQVKRFQIKIEGLTSTLVTDLYDVTDHVLYEAKGTATRKDVRMAIGQLLDYRRHVTPADPQLAILLPSKPNIDLRELLHKEGIALVYRSGGEFVGGILPE